MIQQLIKWSLLSLFGFSYLLQAELKESFSYQERIQLLKMATFGINAELLQDVNATNLENSSSKEIAWLDSQLNSPSAYDDEDDEWVTHYQRLVNLSLTTMPTFDMYAKVKGWHKYNIFNQARYDWIMQHYQMAAWWDNALGNVTQSTKVGSDQLRQRTAYAFSQLLVVSKSGEPLHQRSEGLAHYYDILAKNALGNYETLLQEVLRSPAMGVFLSSAFNKKASLANNTRPDEILLVSFCNFLRLDL